MQFVLSSEKSFRACGDRAMSHNTTHANASRDLDRPNFSVRFRMSSCESRWFCKQWSAEVEKCDKVCDRSYSCCFVCFETRLRAKTTKYVLELFRGTTTPIYIDDEMEKTNVSPLFLYFAANRYSGTILRDQRSE